MTLEKGDREAQDHYKWGNFPPRHPGAEGGRQSDSPCQGVASMSLLIRDVKSIDEIPTFLFEECKRPTTVNIFSIPLHL